MSCFVNRICLDLLIFFIRNIFKSLLGGVFMEAVDEYLGSGEGRRIKEGYELLYDGDDSIDVGQDKNPAFVGVTLLRKVSVSPIRKITKLE